MENGVGWARVLWGRLFLLILSGLLCILFKIIIYLPSGSIRERRFSIKGFVEVVTCATRKQLNQRETTVLRIYCPCLILVRTFNNTLVSIAVFVFQWDLVRDRQTLGNFLEPGNYSNCHQVSNNKQNFIYKQTNNYKYKKAKGEIELFDNFPNPWLFVDTFKFLISLFCLHNRKNCLLIF